MIEIQLSNNTEEYIDKDAYGIGGDSTLTDFIQKAIEEGVNRIIIEDSFGDDDIPDVITAIFDFEGDSQKEVTVYDYGDSTVRPDCKIDTIKASMKFAGNKYFTKNDQTSDQDNPCSLENFQSVIDDPSGWFNNKHKKLDEESSNISSLSTIFGDNSTYINYEPYWFSSIDLQCVPQESEHKNEKNLSSYDIKEVNIYDVLANTEGIFDVNIELVTLTGNLENGALVKILFDKSDLTIKSIEYKNTHELENVVIFIDIKPEKSNYLSGDILNPFFWANVSTQEPKDKSFTYDILSVIGAGREDTDTSPVVLLDLNKIEDVYLGLVREEKMGR